jgi:hypothetical protein
MIRFPLTFVSTCYRPSIHPICLPACLPSLLPSPHRKAPSAKNPNTSFEQQLVNRGGGYAWYHQNRSFIAIDPHKKKPPASYPPKVSQAKKEKEQRRVSTKRAGKKEMSSNQKNNNRIQVRFPMPLAAFPSP